MKWLSLKLNLKQLLEVTPTDKLERILYEYIYFELHHNNNILDNHWFA